MRIERPDSFIGFACVLSRIVRNKKYGDEPFTTLQTIDDYEMNELVSID